MQYPNRLQAALMFEAPFTKLEAAVRDFARIEEMKSGALFNVPETNPGKFYRLFNGDEELMLTFEYVDTGPVQEVFRGALSSAITGILTPDIRDRLTRSRSHVIVEVSHGVLGGVESNPEIASFLETVGRKRDGASKEQFERRLAVLTLMSRVITDHAQPLAVHWTQSDMLVDGEKFETLASMEAPGPLHIHPFLFGPKAKPGEPNKMGIRTYGAQHWLEREILIEPSVIPWGANFETILAFLRVATAENGYVIPDGDTFGPEDRSTSTRVTYREAGQTEDDASAEEGGVPLYVLKPLKHTEFNFEDEDHVPEENVIDDKTLSGVNMPEDQDEKAETVNRWRESRKLAEGMGGRFEVRARDENGEAPPPPPPPAPTIVEPSPSNPGLPSVSGRGLRAKVFGRKGS
ncbi:MAG: hypothetical protein AAF687_04790 [Pseudomonadota bacterium]